MRPVDPEKMRWLESQARDIGNLLGEAVKRSGHPHGFALFLFSFEGAEMTYISNSNREDMVKMLVEFINANSPPLTWDEQHG